VAVILTDQWGVRHALTVEIEGGDNSEWSDVGLFLPFPSRKYVKECECDCTFFKTNVKLYTTVVKLFPKEAGMFDFVLS
jgi:hypothetical protein